MWLIWHVDGAWWTCRGGVGWGVNEMTRRDLETVSRGVIEKRSAG